MIPVPYFAQHRRVPPTLTSNHAAPRSNALLAPTLFPMSPSSNLKQSSMDSFLHHHHHHRPNPIAISKPETPAVEAASDYERIRRETIRRNQEFLHKLGIASAT
ncbi:hypothetical protein GW17_00041478, partial [Ensete ventricosum]